MTKKKLLVLTGAGMSAESGLKTFRDGDGLWENHKIEDVATPQAWKNNPELVLRFYNMRRADCVAAKPNAAHVALANLEKDFEVKIVTQNIDDLHERAGSSYVLHLHGELTKMRSERDDYRFYPFTKDIMLGDKALDVGQFRPHVVWFGEAVPNIEIALELVSEWAEIVVLIGSSLLVYPAASLLQYAPANIPKYVIDKKIPSVNYLENLISIEKPATIGIEDLKEFLSN